MSNNKEKSNDSREKNALSYETDNAKDIKGTVRDKDKNISEEPAFDIRYTVPFIYRFLCPVR